VAVVGKPGVGKSRLVYEFVHSHHTRSWHVLENASVSYGKATESLPKGACESVWTLYTIADFRESSLSQPDFRWGISEIVGS
jgi:GTPase SAR1 family protein